MNKNLILSFVLIANNFIFGETWEEAFIYSNLYNHVTDEELEAINAYIKIYSFIYKKNSYELSESFLCKNHCFRIINEEQKK